MTDSPDAIAPDPGGIQLAPGVRVAAGDVAFSFSGSRGPGGQNVNKRATRAELRVALGVLPLGDDARRRLAGLLGRRLTESGEVVIVSDEHRSQEGNRRACLERLRDLIVRALEPPRPRRPTRPTRASVRRRVDSKRRRSETKRGRRDSPE